MRNEATKRWLPVVMVLATSALPAPLAHASPLSDLAASMAPGTFAELAFPGVNLGDVIRVCGGDSTIGEYADSASWDPVTHQVFFLGTSHGDCYGSKFVIYREDDHTWREGPLPADPCIAPRTDACFGHAYSHNTIDPATGMVYYRHYGDRRIWQFDARGTQAWTVQSTMATRRDTTGCCGGLEFLPSTTRPGLLFVDGSEGVYFGAEPAHDWQLIANTGLAWEATLPTLAMGGYDNFAELDPVHGKILFGGGDSPASLYTYDESGTITPEATAPAGVVTNTTHAWVSVDPVSGRFLLFIDDGSFWEYDAESDTWTRQPGMHPLAARGSFTGFEVPVTSYGVNMFLVWNFDETSVWLYKHRPSEPPPPRDAGVPTSPDAGVMPSGTDAGPTMRADGGTTAGVDAGMASGGSPDDGGCGCRVGGHAKGPLRGPEITLTLLGTLMLVVRGRRRVSSRLR